MSLPYDRRKLEEFKKVYHEKGKFDLEVQVQFLGDLAEYYKERFQCSSNWRDALKAHGLYNSCFVRDGSILWSKKILEIQALYFRPPVDVSLDELQKITRALKRKLKISRLKTRQKLTELTEVFHKIPKVTDLTDMNSLASMLVQRMPGIMRESTEAIYDIIRSVIHHALGVQGIDEAHIQNLDMFSVLGYGATAQEELTPYSAIDVLFLVSDSCSSEKILFEKLALTCQFILINIGETGLKSFKIKELCDDHWFCDTAKKGLRINYETESINSITEPDSPVKTPSELVNYFKYIVDHPATNNSHESITNLHNTVLIYGSEVLHSAFKAETNHYFSEQNGSHYAAEMLRESMTEYKLKPDFTLRDSKHVTKDISRYPSLVMSALMLSFRRTTALSTIESLSEESILGKDYARTLAVSYYAAQYIRQACYAHYEAKYDIAVIESTRMATTKSRPPWTMPQSLLELTVMNFSSVKQHVQGIADDKVVSEERSDYFKQILAAAKYHCGDYLGFLEITPDCNSTTAVESDNDWIQMKIYSFIQSEQFKEAELELDTYFGLLGEDNLERYNFHTLKSDLLISTADFQGALEHAEKALSYILATDGKLNKIASAHAKVASVCRNTADYERALENYGKALKVSLDAYMPHTTNYPESNEQLRKQIKDSKSGIDDDILTWDVGSVDNSDIAVYYMNIGIVFNELSEYEHASICYNKALSIFKRVYGDVDNPDIAYTYLNMGIMYYEKGDYSKALLLHQRALSIFMNHDEEMYHIDIGRSYNNIGLAYERQGDLKKARDNYSKAFSIYLKAYEGVEHRDVADTHINIGSVEDELGNYDKAIESYNSALKIQKKVFAHTDSRDIASTYANIAAAYQNKGDCETALEYNQMSLSLLMKVFGTTEHPEVAMIYNNMGEAYCSLGDYEKALEYYRKDLSISLKVYGDINHSDIALSYHNIGIVHRNVGDYARALENLNKGLTMQLKVYGDVNHPKIALSYYYIGTVYHKLGDYQRAMDNYEKSLTIRSAAYSGSDHPDIVASFKSIAEVCHNRGDLQTALVNYKKAYMMLLRMYNDSEHPEIREMQSIMQNLK